MASQIDPEQFTLVSTQSRAEYDQTPFGDWEDHSSAQRKASLAVLSNSLRKRHPDLTLTLTQPYGCDLVGFAAADLAEAELDPAESLLVRSYVPPAKKLDGARGSIQDSIKFAKFVYRWQDHEYLVYIAESFRDGDFGSSLYTGILKAPDLEKCENAESRSSATDALVLAAGEWTSALHREIWVYDQGLWHKDRGLWENVQRANWDDVILDGEMKEAVRDDIEGFFDEREADEREAYEKFVVPWKRGIILYGPPGNGKTISIRAMMKTLGDRSEPIASLYVKSLPIWNPAAGVRSVFQKARATAPCFLILEDVDSLISPGVRSYFLNEVDGLEDNAGILILGSTNHLEQLDPGIAKRPSRFDRKYLFPLPSLSERIQYCEYWRSKLSSNAEIEFPRPLCAAIARITEDFSFAYMKEAFVAALLVLVRGRKEMSGCARVNESRVAKMCLGDDEEWEKLPLWIEIKKQIHLLRKELDTK